MKWRYCFHCHNLILLKAWAKCGSKLFCCAYCFIEWLKEKARESEESNDKKELETPKA